jgi:hypothetical protein
MMVSDEVGADDIADIVQVASDFFDAVHIRVDHSMQLSDFDAVYSFALRQRPPWSKRQRRAAAA